MKGRLLVEPDAEALAARAALLVEERAKAAIRKLGSWTFVLAGGDTPRRLYRLLARRHHEGQSAGHLWERAHLLFGDERAVGPEDPASNFRMARESLLDGLPVPPECVHRIRGELGAERAAEAYEAELRGLTPFPRPRFDVVLLGLGADGHTASLFAGEAALEEREHWVAPTAPHAEPRRITLTPPALAGARALVFLVSGREKSSALARALAGEDLPATRIEPMGGELWWLADAEAAAFIERRGRRS